MKRLDPTRPTTFAMDKGWDTGVGRVVDVLGFNYRTNQMEAYHHRHPAQPIIGTETGSTVATRGEYANDPARHIVRAYDTEHPWWATTAEEWWTIVADRPYIAGGFVWTGFDYRGEPTPFDTLPSISSQFGILDTCGFPKDNYYYYRAWWRPDRPLVHLLPHWNWPGREGQAIEVPLSNFFLIVVGAGSLFIVAGKRHAELNELGDASSGHRQTLGEYSDSFLNYVRAVTSGVAITGYALWAFERAAEVGNAFWFRLSIVPFVLAILRYALTVEQGGGGAPEEVVLRDRMLQLLGVVWLACFAIGVHAG